MTTHTHSETRTPNCQDWLNGLIWAGQQAMDFALRELRAAEVPLGDDLLGGQLNADEHAYLNRVRHFIIRRRESGDPSSGITRTFVIGMVPRRWPSLGPEVPDQDSAPSADQVYLYSELMTAVASLGLREAEAAVDRSVAAWSRGELTDGQVSRLREALDDRRKTAKQSEKVPPGYFVKHGKLIKRRRDHKYPVTDESIRKRRRCIALPLPYAVREQLPFGAQVVAAILHQQFVQRGKCDLTLHEIAEKAGYSRSHIKRLLALMAAKGLITTIEHERTAAINLPNTTYCCAEIWTDWIMETHPDRGPLPRPPLNKDSSKRGKEAKTDMMEAAWLSQDPDCSSYLSPTALRFRREDREERKQSGGGKT